MAHDKKRNNRSATPEPRSDRDRRKDANARSDKKARDNDERPKKRRRAENELSNTDEDYSDIDRKCSRQDDNSDESEKKRRNEDERGRKHKKSSPGSSRRGKKKHKKRRSRSRSRERASDKESARRKSPIRGGDQYKSSPRNRYSRSRSPSPNVRDHATPTGENFGNSRQDNSTRCESSSSPPLAPWALVYTCQKCKMGSQIKSIMEEHFSFFHQLNDEQEIQKQMLLRFKCKTCHVEIGSESLLEEHFDIDHNMRINVSVFQSKTKSDDLEFAQPKTHGHTVPIAHNDLDTGINSDIVIPSELHACPLCKFTAEDEKTIQIHVECHTDYRDCLSHNSDVTEKNITRFKCPRCPFEGHTHESQ